MSTKDFENSENAELPPIGGGGALADDLRPGRAGALDPAVGEQILGADSPPRPSYSDPLPGVDSDPSVSPPTPDRTGEHETSRP